MYRATLLKLVLWRLTGLSLDLTLAAHLNLALLLINTTNILRLLGLLNTLLHGIHHVWWSILCTGHGAKLIRKLGIVKT